MILADTSDMGTIVGATISGLAIIIVVVLENRKTRTRNTKEHEAGKAVALDVKGHLLDLHEKVDDVKDEIVGVKSVVEEHTDRLVNLESNLQGVTDD